MSKKTIKNPKANQLLVMVPASQTIKIPELPALPKKSNEPKTLYTVTAGEYNTSCVFDGKQFLIDHFVDGSPIPLYDYETADGLIKKANAFRTAQGWDDAGYRMVPVFEITVIND
jgi:hypothetical protein